MFWAAGVFSATEREVVVPSVNSGTSFTLETMMVTSTVAYRPPWSVAVTVTS